MRSVVLTACLVALLAGCAGEMSSPQQASLPYQNQSISRPGFNQDNVNYENSGGG